MSLRFAKNWLLSAFEIWVKHPRLIRHPRQFVRAVTSDAKWWDDREQEWEDFCKRR